VLTVELSFIVVINDTNAAAAGEAIVTDYMSLRGLEV
jgi:hypothetical protein